MTKLINEELKTVSDHDKEIFERVLLAMVNAFEQRIKELEDRIQGLEEHNERETLYP